MTWLVSLIVVSLVTYHYRKLVDSVKQLQEIMAVKLKKEKVPDSVILDPDNVEQMARIEFEEMQKKLNDA